MYRNRAVFLVVAAWAAAAPAWSADKLPAISQADRDLKEAPGEPTATAVYLIQSSTIHLQNILGQEPSSTIATKVRLKILKDEGKSYGEIAIAHNDAVRLSRFEGRTITPDGKIVKVDSKGKFKRKLSDRTKRQVSTIAFPNVEVGSILEYEYDLAFDSYMLLEPWYFMDELPVLFSEVVWEVPYELQSRVWKVPTFGVTIEGETKRRPNWVEARFFAKNLPSTPNEPHGFPFRDQATRLMVVPIAFKNQDFDIPLFDSWATVCGKMDKDYVLLRRDIRETTAKAQSLTAGRSQEDEKVRALYRFVRDEVKTVSGSGPWVDERQTLDKILAKREGTSAEKALLLQSLLLAVGIESRLVWAADRDRGGLTPDLPNASMFDRVIVSVTRGEGLGQILDPTDRSLSEGRLSPGYEGTPALLHDAKDPKIITLPMTSFVAHQRQAKVELKIDGEGRAAGTGELMLRGHYAWEQSFPLRDAKETQESWQKWADAAMPGYKITDIRVDDQPDASTLKVQWAMAATEESVLGDEVSFVPARPIGPVKQPFPVGAVERRSPVILDHAGVEEVETKITFPQGWTLATPPQPVTADLGIGAYRVVSALDAAAGVLVVKRRMEIRKREPSDRVEFGALRNLFAEGEKRDAQTVVLARR